MKNWNCQLSKRKEPIKILENEVVNIKKILNTQKKELEKEEALRKMKEDQLLSEIKNIKGTCDKLKAQLQVKISYANVSKTEIQKLRSQIAEMEGKLKEPENKKS